MQQVLVGAKFFCPLCETRGIDRACECESSSRVSSIVDLTSPEGSRHLESLTSGKLSVGTPAKSELLRAGLTSKLQWAASLVTAAVTFLEVYTDRRTPNLSQAAAVLFLFVLWLWAVRMLVFVAAMLFRLLVCLVLLTFAGVFGVLEALSPSRTPRASILVDRAEAALSGIYLHSSHRVSVRELERNRGPSMTLVLREDLVLVWSIGSRGRLAFRDAEIPPFEATAADGATVAVTMHAGAIELETSSGEKSTDSSRFPLLGEVRRRTVQEGTPIVVLGGAWIEADIEASDRQSFRDAPVRRRLLGAPETPLEIRLD